MRDVRHSNVRATRTSLSALRSTVKKIAVVTAKNDQHLRSHRAAPNISSIQIMTHFDRGKRNGKKNKENGIKKRTSENKKQTLRKKTFCKKKEKTRKTNTEREKERKLIERKFDHELRHD